jgi:hypothetical protein
MKIELSKSLILESFVGNQRQIFDDTNKTSERLLNATAGIPVVGTLASKIGQATAGYEVGDKLGHPVAGTLLGRAGALGATSAEPKSKLTVDDAYTPSNMINKGINGASVGTVAGFMAGGPVGALIGAPVGAAINTAVAPGIEYGIGKLFSGRNQFRK